MYSGSAGLFVLDYLCRPFAKILEKMPLLMVVILFCIYAPIAYQLLRSAYLADQQ